MTDWIEWNGGKCPIKSDKTRVEYKCRGGYKRLSFGFWLHIGSPYDIIAYRITEDHEPKMTPTREQITAQIEALQKQLDAMPVVVRRWFHNGSFFPFHEPHFKNYFDIETINGVPHIHGVPMKEVGK